MRAAPLLIVISATLVAGGAAGALEAGDSMAAWKGASAAEKAALVRKLLKRSNSASQSNVIKCVDEAATFPGHTDLRIAKIVKACVSSTSDSQPV